MGDVFAPFCGTLGSSCSLRARGSDCIVKVLGRRSPCCGRCGLCARMLGCQGLPRRRDSLLHASIACSQYLPELLRWYY